MKVQFVIRTASLPVADPGFPVGGGGTNLRCIHFLAKMYVKMKEIDPVGGGHMLAVPPWIHQ